MQLQRAEGERGPPKPQRAEERARPPQITASRGASEAPPARPPTAGHGSPGPGQAPKDPPPASCGRKLSSGQSSAWRRSPGQRPRPPVWVYQGQREKGTTSSLAAPQMTAKTPQMTARVRPLPWAARAPRPHPPHPPQRPRLGSPPRTPPRTGPSPKPPQASWVRLLPNFV